MTALNWREIEYLVAKLKRELESGDSLFADRLIVPERSKFQEGYLKGEWALRFTSRRSEGVFIFSIRPRHPYFFYLKGKGPKAATKGTRSPFDLEASKRIKGQKLLSIEALPRERTVVLWFNRAEGGKQGLVLNLIPAAPEALLVEEKTLAILTRSRTVKHNTGEETHYTFPDGSKAPAELPLREELLGTFSDTIEKELDLEAFDLRLKAAQRGLRDLAKQAADRMRQTQTALREAEGDRDWRKYGDLLKSSLHEVGTGKNRSSIDVTDYETGEKVTLPLDPKLTPSAQVEKLYQLARRRNRRISEARLRIDSLRETCDRANGALAKIPADWKALEALERFSAPRAVSAPERGKSKGAWLGKVFLSKDELAILVGKSKDENLELTFKHACGNDIWMHVRGRPGAHVLVPLQPGKSAPLETLLDAATLAIYYSGGENWGKTEVDYTFKKYVKRIKDSSEASYTNNKTLLVDPDPKRIKRLLSEQTG
jgi:predicted ribosome quality control (RQC) complex YloA/Tae2 family protein